MSHLWQADELGQDSMSGLPDEIDPVVSNRRYFNTGSLLWWAENPGASRLTAPPIHFAKNFEGGEIRPKILTAFSRAVQPHRED